MHDPEHRAAARPLGRPHRARRPRHRRREGALHRVRRQPADRAERPRVRRARRHVVHRPRQGPRGRVRAPRRRLLRRSPTARRSARSCSRSTSPNGIGLSPDGDAAVRRPRRTPAACTAWDVDGPGRGRAAEPGRRTAAVLLRAARACSCSTRSRSTATATSWSATLVTGGAHRDLADGRGARPGRVLGDPMVTNVCFGGDDLRTAYVTLLGDRASSCRFAWPRPGSQLDVLTSRRPRSTCAWRRRPDRRRR